jgi:hypothetical protein
MELAGSGPMIHYHATAVRSAKSTKGVITASFRLSIAMVLVTIATAKPDSARSTPAFEVVTAGIVDIGCSWGGGWRDFNANGFSDFWAHRSSAACAPTPVLDCEPTTPA